MNEWTVVSVLVVLTGLLVSVVKPLIQLNSTITRLAAAVEELERNLNRMAAKNSEAHGKLWERSQEQEETLRSHELRLRRMEEP